MKIVTARRIGDALMQLGLLEDQLHPRDGEYALMDVNGVALFGKRFASWLWENSMDYAGDRWDCDDYASAARLFASIDHAKWAKVDAGVAFGECWYFGETGGHAINFTAHENEHGQIEIKLWEPQVQWNRGGTAKVSLSEVPLSSVQRWLFASW